MHEVLIVLFENSHSGHVQANMKTTDKTSSHFMTKMPLFDAALISILSTPVPALPISFNLVPALMTSSVTLVADLTIKQSKS